MKKYHFVSVILGILFLSGCIDVDVQTTFNPGGGGTQAWRFTSTSLMAGQLRKQVNSQFHFQELKEDFQEGDFILTGVNKFQSPDQLNNRFHRVTWQKSGLWKQAYIYTDTWIAQKSRVPIKMRIAVDVPGTITKSNADESQNQTAIWMFEANDVQGSKVLRVEFYRWNFLLLVPAALLAWAVICFGLLMMIDARPVVCANCGKKVPRGSAFCNSCGSKMETGP
jgi:zinc ribbon protein